MKKLFTLLCCLGSLACFAQAPKIDSSEPFDEPEALESKVVQCANGNTFLFSFTKSDGIDVAVYDASHKRVATQKLSGGPDSWDPSNFMGGMFSGVSKGSKVPAIYAMGSTVVVFLEQVAEREPSLYRIILNSADGKLIKEERISQMPSYAKGSAYAMAFGGVRPKEYIVERSNASDAYAVMAFDGFAEETSKRIEVVHYAADHKEIGRSYFDAPETRYKYINYLGMVVDGTKAVHVATYCYGTNATTGAGSKIFMSQLSGNTFVHHPLDFTRDLKDTRGTLLYNPVSKMLELFTISEVDAKSSSGFGNAGRDVIVKELFVVVDPTTYTVVQNKMPNNMGATKYRKKHYDEDEERYTGVPMNVVINADGSTTVIAEDEVPEIQQAPGMGFVKAGPGRSVFINNLAINVKSNSLFDVGITDYDVQANEQAGYVVRKSQKAHSLIYPFAHRDLRNNRIVFERKKGFGTEANIGYYSFDYISAPSGRYVIFNDHPKNFERDAEKKPKTLQGVSDANTICYKLNSGGEMSKMYFFGEPDKDFDNRLCMISSGDYTAATGDYAVMIIEKNGRKKQARLAWAHLN